MDWEGLELQNSDFFFGYLSLASDMRSQLGSFGDWCDMPLDKAFTIGVRVIVCTMQIRRSEFTATSAKQI